MGYLLVDATSGAVLPLAEDERRIVRERALIAAAESQGALSADAQGYVPAEYARRRANGYMNDHLSLHYSATDAVFIPLERPLWQFVICFRLPRRHITGIMGTIDVDARTGEPLPLPAAQLARIRERTHALVRPQPSPPAG